ncbi:hypothetical protein GCM10010174_35960 [Kutzneria viridogrisea]|uniref:[acyl-carrier-protein] S-malonyltransferase n=2 Tax=Kutzneria TaxID=43356 RepID=W5W227_9PSEU|nr:ACP S-malonyltransferase [Kutzneria albida]AHH94850.1 malonyl-CoA-[acyl-carrier-protein] transacylase [Kutzneria albida DSM 43870]MBA8927806.1 [acyl-carrier-protein] S-malonyltransferase [Kutzneria viridogrisea]
MAGAVVFPGMGPADFTEVGRFMVGNAVARRLVAQADEVLGYSLVDRFRETEGDYSEYAQVAFLVNSVALAHWAQDALGLRPQYCTGASFGAKSAVAYSGALSFADTVLLTARLARHMEDFFSRELTDLVTHSFVRTPRELLDEVRAELDARGEWNDVSCYVDEDFYMLSLPESSVDWLQQRLRSAGGLSLYTMRPPMHCAAFAPLRAEVERDLFTGLEFADPELPVIADQDGTVIRGAEGMRTLLLDGFTRALCWPEVVASLREQGVDTVHVCGVDSLFGRVKVTRNAFTVVAVDPRLAMRPRRPVLAARAV